MRKEIEITVLILLSLTLLAGCKNEQPKSAVMDWSTAYPEQIQPAVIPDAGTLQPGVMSAPVRENGSIMNVEVLSLARSDRNPDFVVVHVLVNATAPAAGLEEYDPNLAGQEIDINLRSGDAASMLPGDIIRLTVTYRGDEWGGGYYGSDINHQN